MAKRIIYTPFTEIYLERTMCYGTCPVYHVTITGTGQVTYFGEHWVDKVGIHTWTIDETAIQALNDAIKKYRYFTMKEKYDEMIIRCSDMPSCITSVRLEDGRYRKIIHEYGADYYPSVLKTFENKVDRIIGIETYVGDGGMDTI